MPHWLPTLKQIGLTDEVRDLTSMWEWDQFFGIDKTTYWKLMMEFISSFELDKTIISLN